MTDQVGIGELIRELSDEFPDLTVSKVRFLEAQGIVTPTRTAAGYRRFGNDDRQRIVYALRAQRDHFLPLRVIAEHLEAMSRGLTPALVDPAPRAPQEVPAEPGGRPAALRMTDTELRRDTGLSRAQLAEAENQGLLAPDAEGLYGPADLEAARAVAALAELGLSGRHLRAVRLAADRIIGVVDQSAQAAERDPGRRAQRAQATVAQAERLITAILDRHVDTEYPSNPT